MNRRRILTFILTLVLLLSFAPAASALYQWVDEKGNLHITDNPPPSRQPREEPEAPRTPEAPVPAPSPAQPAPPAAPAPALKPAAASQQTSPSQTAAQPPVRTPAPTAPPAPAPTPPPAKEAPRGHVTVPFPQGSAPPENFLTAIVAGFMTVILFIVVGMYIFFSLCMYLIAKKLNVAEAWASWIPILQVWPFLTSAGKPIWWVIFLLIPLVNAFVGVYLWMCIAENLGRSKWLGLLMLLPLVNFVLMGVLAFTKEEAGGSA